jgi:hypothetical protein
MEIRQRIGGLPEGLYQLQCKASTQHYCLSDQHGYLYTSSEQSETPCLQRDYLDIPNTPSAWQTLTSLPVYVSGKTDTLTIGFVGNEAQTPVDTYTNNGSLYMASLAFMPLGLPADATFWTAEQPSQRLLTTCAMSSLIASSVLAFMGSYMKFCSLSCIA